MDIRIARTRVPIPPAIDGVYAQLVKGKSPATSPLAIVLYGGVCSISNAIIDASVWALWPDSVHMDDNAIYMMMCRAAGVDTVDTMSWRDTRYSDEFDEFTSRVVERLYAERYSFVIVGGELRRGLLRPDYERWCVYIDKDEAAIIRDCRAAAKSIGAAVYPNRSDSGCRETRDDYKEYPADVLPWVSLWADRYLVVRVTRTSARVSVDLAAGDYTTRESWQKAVRWSLGVKDSVGVTDSAADKTGGAKTALTVLRRDLELVATDKLYAHLTRGRVPKQKAPHAVIIVAPPGSGKSTLARLWPYHVNVDYDGDMYEYTLAKNKVSVVSDATWESTIDMIAQQAVRITEAAMEARYNIITAMENPQSRLIQTFIANGYRVTLLHIRASEATQMRRCRRRAEERGRVYDRDNADGAYGWTMTIGRTWLATMLPLWAEWADELAVVDNDNDDRAPTMRDVRVIDRAAPHITNRAAWRAAIAAALS